MPHPKLLNSLQISQLVEDRAKNLTPFRVLGSIFGISGSSAYNYWRRYGKDTDVANGMSEQAKTAVNKTYDEELEAELLSWQDWFTQPETPQPSVSPSANYPYKQAKTSHGHSDMDKMGNAGATVNTPPNGLQPSTVFSSPSGKKKLLRQMGISSE